MVVKTFKVKLSRLDTYPSIAWNGISAVWGDLFRIIGTCRIEKEGGKFVGYVEMDEMVSPELFFYYMGNYSEHGFYHFDGLLFSENKREGVLQIKDMLI